MAPLFISYFLYLPPYLRFLFLLSLCSVANLTFPWESISIQPKFIGQWQTKEIIPSKSSFANQFESPMESLSLGLSQEPPTSVGDAKTAALIQHAGGIMKAIFLESPALLVGCCSTENSPTQPSMPKTTCSSGRFVSRLGRGRRSR